MDADCLLRGRHDTFSTSGILRRDLRGRRGAFGTFKDGHGNPSQTKEAKVLEQYWSPKC